MFLLGMIKIPLASPNSCRKKSALRRAKPTTSALTPKDGNWVLVSDAWFFKEGEAARWEKARYGEFRVLPDGRALLVGMRGPELEKL